MESITVRRWVAARPTEVWRRLVELDRLVERDGAVALEAPVAAHRGPSTTVALLTGGERWLLTISVDAIAGATGCGSDVRLHVERDPTCRRHAPRPAAHRHRRVVRHLRGLLDVLVQALDTVDLDTVDLHLDLDHDEVALDASGREPQRIASGR